jgi:hypothetical protein
MAPRQMRGEIHPYVSIALFADPPPQIPAGG